ncbi:hypothetical protein Tco_0780823 [Tanacetum coccineum]
MDSDKYLEGQSMQRPPLFESDSFIYWKNRFETYVKSKDLDLWHVITNGDFQPIQQNPLIASNRISPLAQGIEEKESKFPCTIEMDNYDDVDGGDDHNCDLMRISISSLKGKRAS